MKRFLLASLLFAFAEIFFFSCGKSGETFGKARLVCGESETETECRISPAGKLQVELESLCAFLNLDYETCHRCGHTEVELGGDRIAVLWDAPYIDYMNKSRRIKLGEKSVLHEGKVFVQPDFLEKCGFAKVTVSKKERTVSFEK